MTTARAVLLAAVCALALGCKEKNPNYCPEPPCDEVDAPTCDDNNPCPSGVCRNSVCVPECVNDGECTNDPNKPICSEMACKACSTHAQCTASNACLPTGACGTDANVAYVDPGGTDNGTCGFSTKCATISAALMTGKAYVKVSGTSTQNVTITGSRNVTLLADIGAKITAASGSLFNIQNTATVTIYDLHIEGTGQTIGIQVSGGNTPTIALERVRLTGHGNKAVEVGAGMFAMRRSRVSGNGGAQSGGIDISGPTTFDISNNFILFNGVDNGPNASTFGGARLQSNTTGSKFEYNTVVGNSSDGTNSGGVLCNGAMVSAQGNIIVENSEDNVVSDQTQRAGNCNFGMSLSQGASLAGFKMPMAPDFDFHLTSDSPTSVRDVVMTCDGTDVDGDARPYNNACDLGADEYMGQ